MKDVFLPSSGQNIADCRKQRKCVRFAEYRLARRCRSDQRSIEREIVAEATFVTLVKREVLDLDCLLSQCRNAKYPRQAMTAARVPRSFAPTTDVSCST